MTAPKTFFDVPAGACDCHMHIVGPFADYPLRETRSLSPREAVWDEYAKVSASLHLRRCVVVQPSFFATDNHCTLDSVARAPKGDAVAVVVVEPSVTRDEIAKLHERGARAVRAQMIVAGGLQFSALEAVADAIAPFGWHLELFLDTSDLPAFSDRLRELPVPIVFDHMGQWLPGDRTDEKGFKILVDMVANGRAWTKLSNPRFAPSEKRARELIAANPDRVVWGTDWPHVSYKSPLPNDNGLLRLLRDWSTDDATFHKILVDNPQALYFNKY
jgi:predicted TIM-barrel fold metal-dependent hydrolase